MNSYLQATDSSIFIPGSALAAASESVSSCTAQGSQQEGHCPSPSPAPLSWAPHPWGDQVLPLKCSWVSGGSGTHYAPVWPTAAQAPSLLCLTFWFSHLTQKGLLLLMFPPGFFFCSTGRKNIQWCLKGEQPLKKTEPEPVPRSQGTHIRRSHRSWFPLRRAYCCTKNRGRSFGLIFPPLLFTPPGPLYLLHLYTAGYKYHLMK